MTKFFQLWQQSEHNCDLWNGHQMRLPKGHNLFNSISAAKTTKNYVIRIQRRIKIIIATTTASEIYSDTASASFLVSEFNLYFLLSLLGSVFALSRLLIACSVLSLQNFIQVRVCASAKSSQ